MKNELSIFFSHGPSTAIYGVSKMQPFSWSEAELLKSVPSDHTQTEKRYSLNNEDFGFTSPLEVFWVLDGHGLLREGATYYAADFAKVEPDCFDQVEDFLETLEMRYLEKFENAEHLYFTDADEVAKLALKRAIAGWIDEHIFVEHQWCMVGQSQQLAVSRTDLPHDGMKDTSLRAAAA